MAERNNLSAPPASLGKRMLLGAAIALIPISLFLVTAGEPDPNWPKLWMLRPLVIVPLAGAMGAAFYYFMDRLRYQFGWRRVWVIVLSVVVYITGVFFGIILGLDGTWWD